MVSRILVLFGAVASLGACTGLLAVDFDGRLRESDAGPTAPDLDGGEDADAGRTFCATITPPPIFCSDFDRGDLLSEWNPTTNSGTNPHLLAEGSSIGPEISQFRSGPRSARFVSPTLTGTAAIATAFAAVDMKPDPDYLLLRTAIRIETESFLDAGAGGDIRILELEFPSAGAIRITRSQKGTRLSVIDFATQTERYSSITIPLTVGKWADLTLQFHNGYGNRTDVVAILDTPPESQLSTPASFKQRLGKPVILRAGVVSAVSPVGDFVIDFDDIRVDYQP